MSDEDPPRGPLPEYLERMSSVEIFVRRGDAIDVAPAADLAVVRDYPRTRARGPLVDGRRMTLMTAKRAVGVGEAVRVIHVLEVERAGEELFVMGPKPVVGEHVDGKLAGDPVPEWGAFTMGIYDGAVLPSPGVDTNYEITSYTFHEPGVHRIQWRAGEQMSNVLCVEVR